MSKVWFLLISLIVCSPVIAQWQNCNANPLFSEFTIFPNPVPVGQNVFVRAVINPNEQISDGSALFRVFRNTSDSKNALISIPGISVCNLTEAVTCPILPGEHIYTWQFQVPDLPDGVYLFRYDFDLRSSQACLLFDLTILPNSTSNATSYTSHYEAILDGTANFQTPSVLNRTWGDQIQVGPFGGFPKSIGSGFNYGIFSEVTGSGDLIPEGGLDTDNYVWGLFGSLKSIAIGNTSVQHNYTGTFYVGYFPIYLPASATDLNNSILEGDFALSWTYYDPDYTRGYINGVINIASPANLPASWGFPLLFGRLDSVVVTDSNGRLKAQGSTVLCLAGGDGCEALPAPNSATTGSGDKFSNTELGAVIGAILGFAFLVIVLVAFLTYMKNKRESEEEDGVFAVARKPEYGSALILDDIIQETSGKNRDLRPMLDPRRRLEAQDSLSEDDDLGYAAPEDDFSNSIASRSASVSNSRSVSRKQPRRDRERDRRNRDTSDRDDDRSENEEDESRSRSPTSRSPAARNRGRSTSRDSRSRSGSPAPKRGRSRSLSDHRKARSESEPESDPGSSASRRSDDDSDEE